MGWTTEELEETLKKFRLRWTSTREYSVVIEAATQEEAEEMWYDDDYSQTEVEEREDSTSLELDEVEEVDD